MEEEIASLRVAQSVLPAETSLPPEEGPAHDAATITAELPTPSHIGETKSTSLKCEDTSKNNVISNSEQLQSQNQSQDDFTLVTSNHQASRKNRIDKSEVDLMLLVDSNGRDIQMKRLCPNLAAKKVPCPTISHVGKVLDSYKGISNVKPSTIICHFGTNDLEQSSSQDFIQSFCNTISELCKVFPSSKIIVSELLPRLDHFDASISHCNSQIHRKCAILPNVHFISHNNSIRPERQMFRDTKHLNRTGFFNFIKNLKGAIYGPTYKGKDVRSHQYLARGVGTQFNMGNAPQSRFDTRYYTNDPQYQARSNQPIFPQYPHANVWNQYGSAHLFSKNPHLKENEISKNGESMERLSVKQRDPILPSEEDKEYIGKDLIRSLYKMYCT